MEINSYSRNEILVDFAKGQQKTNDKYSGLSEEVKTKPIEAQHFSKNTNDKILPAGITANVSFDKEINQMVVNINSSETGELIKTIPSEEVIAFMKKMAEFAKENSRAGGLVDIKI